MPQVIALGDINLDLIAHISHYPPSGGDGVASAFWIKSGGSAANTARALARCGISTALIGRVSTDALAGQLLDDLHAAGVDVSQIQRDPTVPSGMMFITVTPDGQRTMFGYRGANARTDPRELDPEAIRSARWLHISGYALLESPQAQAALRALDIASSSGLRVSVDLGLEAILRQPARVNALLPRVNVLFPNADEARALAATEDPKQAIARLGRKGVPLVALKSGGRGCILGRGDELYPVPAFPIDVVDTTGAGDAFAAGFLAGRSHGLGLRACGLWANAMGALAASVEGSAVPERGALVSFLREKAHRPRWRGWEEEFEAILASLDRSAGSEGRYPDRQGPV